MKKETKKKKNKTIEKNKVKQGNPERERAEGVEGYHLIISDNTRVLQKVLSLGSDYFSATFYQIYFYYKPSKYSPFTETHF